MPRQNFRFPDGVSATKHAFPIASIDTVPPLFGIRVLMLGLDGHASSLIASA